MTNRLNDIAVIVSVVLSLGGLAYSAGHLSSRVEVLEKVDARHELQLHKVDNEADAIRAQLATITAQQEVILNDLQWLKRYLEATEGK